MNLADDRPSLPLPKAPNRDNKVSCETLSHVDWYRTRQFEAHEYHSDGDEAFWGPELEFENRSPEEPKGFRTGTHLFACFPPKIVGSKPMMSPAREGKRGAADAVGRPGTHPSPIRHSGAIPHSGTIPHSGPIKLNTGPIIGHTGPLKSLPKGCSIIPAEVIGKKKPPGYDAGEPTSPEVTCLGRVRIKQKYCKELAMVADRRQAKQQKVKVMKKKGASDSSGKGKQREMWGAKEASEPAARIDFDVDLSRFNSACGVLSSIPADCGEAKRKGGAILAQSLVYLLRESSQERQAEYVPQEPPPNSLLLMRGGRNLDRQSESPAAQKHFGWEKPACQHQTEEQAECKEAEQNKKATMERYFSLPKPPPEASIWQRRAVAQPSALDIIKTTRLDIKKPSTR